jgi:phosphosulfolactate synthase
MGSQAIVGALDAKTVQGWLPPVNRQVMVIDQGSGEASFMDMLESHSNRFRWVKLTNGQAIDDLDLTLKKAGLCKSHGIEGYAGGTLVEWCIKHGKTNKLLDLLGLFGFEWCEVSDGTINLPEEDRWQLIRFLTRHGIKVISEIGKKKPEDAYRVGPDDWSRIALRDLDEGAEITTLEARSTGTAGIAVGGRLDTEIIDRVLASGVPPCRLMIEAPTRTLQVEAIRTYPEACLGNVFPADIMMVSALRRGLAPESLEWFQQAQLQS